MYTVKANDHAGRPATFACGTADQALEKTWELARRGFKDIVVTDPKGHASNAAAFERSLDLA
ncbi:hypothetical protein MKK70_10335 [Methylobacterium sp. E-041]|uniref:Uncharacterized protein n=1 Tax=Methylobacterium cerastii TaxID=932741 RepID=A0ABQ4QIT6_9HYPH|nr:MULTISPECIES: hypothetical protein [Methylobacterium]TXM96600.1 hypothetical protein FV219_16305 [Methylobacterium sp. WL122]MCJ2007644.1 hypothetical protein [Methylobacterium sp. J-092]MCJ2042601.1 hypothetical protein [Methylobacterium sp. J-059]MCJ2078219.1 hypothetical protein [Methylobacterium sp. E-016]MCJ2105761.1 hypothetical protein [Methylobacterium sp. E-041]